MIVGRRWKIAIGAVLAAAVATCWLPTDLRSEGGGWYTRYTSGMSMDSRGRTALYRRGPLGVRIKVDDNAFVHGFVEPDCILYEPQGQPGWINAACGHRRPVLVAAYPPWSDAASFELDSTGFHRTDSLRVVDGRPIATVTRVPIAGIRRAAESQPALRLGFPNPESRTLAVEPVVRDEPVDVDRRDWRGTTALMEAARAGQRDAVAALLRAGADVNATDSLGWTALHAALGGFDADTAVVRTLLEGGARTDIANGIGTTPLQQVAIGVDTANFRQLLAKGADPCRPDGQGQTVLDIASPERPAMHRAAVAAYARCRKATTR